MSKIFVVGNTPAAAVCAIYLKTGNYDVTIIKSDSKLKYKVTAVAGVDEPDNFTDDSYKQCEYLDINVIEEEVEKVEFKNGYILNDKYECDYLVVERDLYNLAGTKNLFVINCRENAEGLVLAGEGCKTALKMKDFVK